jgi:hypothetical protein
MPNTVPSWDDVLDKTPLNMGGILDAIRAAVSKLPTGFGAEEVEATVRAKVTEAFSLENLLSARANVVPALTAFVAAGGAGPVEKSPTDLM